MTLSTNVNNFLHIKPILDLAIENKGGVYALPTKTAAIRFRMESYQYRKLLLKDGPTPYDKLVIKLNGTSVILELRSIQGKFTTQDGTIIEPTMASVIDPSLAFAVEFAKTLDGD